MAKDEYLEKIVISWTSGIIDSDVFDVIYANIPFDPVGLYNTDIGDDHA